MKTIKILFAIILVCCLALGADAKKAKETGGNALISFNRESHDFGIISEDGGAVSTEFEFINLGNAPLIIYSANADCGCTRPKYPKNPIAPGKKGVIKVSFLPKAYSGSFVKNVKVRSNGSSKVKVLKISGTVNPNKDK